MDSSDRKSLGKAGSLQEEIAEATSFALEKELHSQYAGWLNRNGFAGRYFHADMRKRSTLWVGHPDFSVWRGTRILFIEFKVAPNGLSLEQEKRFSELLAEGSTVLVAYSYQEAVRKTQEFFAL